MLDVQEFILLAASYDPDGTTTNIIKTNITIIVACVTCNNIGNNIRYEEHTQLDSLYWAWLKVWVANDFSSDSQDCIY